jgi:4-aminobutyrate--pyruvate transaminase
LSFLGIAMLSNSLAHTDATHHFHPQTDPRLLEERGPLVIVEGKGAQVVDSSGRAYIEGMASLWCASLGFNEPRLAEAAHRQISRLGSYHTFNHRSNEPCVQLVEALAGLSPIQPAHFFFANSGSEANDTMVKFAWFYNAARGLPDKRRIISRTGAFHGSTVMGAALSGLPHMHRAFNLPTNEILYAGRPLAYRDALPGESDAAFATRLATELEALILREGPETIAAMIAEPVMGAGGVVVPPADYFPQIQAVLRRHDVLLLSDEVICGFGRTGNWFGCQTFGVEPDMLSVAKGLSSGYMPIAAVAVSDAVYQVIADEAHRLGVLGHGFTYSGHPVTAAVALETLHIYQEMNVVEVSRRLGGRLQAGLRETLRDHPLVGDIRGLGFIAGIELVANRESRQAFDPNLRVGAQVERACLERGLILRNMGDTIALCPPFVISEGEVDTMLTRLRDALDAVAQNLSRSGTVLDA